MIDRRIIIDAADEIAPKYESERLDFIRCNSWFPSGPILGTSEPKIDGRSVLLFVSSFPQSDVARDLQATIVKKFAHHTTGRS